MQARKGGLRAAFFLGAAVLGFSAAPALAQGTLVVRCPGPPVLYTSELSAEQARQARCTPLMDLPVATGAPQRARQGAQQGSLEGSPQGPPQGSPGPSVARAPNASSTASSVSPREILLAEVDREQQRLSALEQRLATAVPTAAEREELQRARLRAETDLQAIRRELRRLEGNR